MRKYRAAELTARQALDMATAMAKAHGCPIVWIAWLRSPRWGEFDKSDTLHDWTGNRQTVLFFCHRTRRPSLPARQPDRWRLADAALPPGHHHRHLRTARRRMATCRRR